jgi:aminopeptidase N
MQGTVWRLLPLSILLGTFGCSDEPPAFLVLDSATEHPIEGALVYAPGKLAVLRSDVHGTVSLPEGWEDADLVVWARDHRPLRIHPADVAQGPIHLPFDPAIVNPAESGYRFDRADTLRGTYGPHRENNDLLSYDLDIRVDVADRSITGVNRIRFRMLEEGNRIQLDLFENMSVDSILYQGAPLAHVREHNAVFLDFPMTLRKSREYTVDFHYSGRPVESGRFGGFAFREDSLGNPWIFTACQNIGASLWWPNKDQQPDEPDSMTLAVTVPSDLVEVSNGRLVGVEDLGDGTTRFRWKIHYPINNYSVSVNIGRYTHFSDTLGDLTLDYFVLPHHLEEARAQFAQVRPMLQCFQDRIGPYPFPEDGYKLVEVPYSGMEHQSAVTYGNLFRNGYLGRDWTGVGISPRFDFIIVHESAHEWFGNSVTANDVSDAWIHEGFGTYLEGVYVECMWGYEDALAYLNGYRTKVGNREPVIGPTGVNHWPTQDQYFKGALFLNTLRHVVDDDAVWWTLLQDYADHFKHRNIWTQDVINFFNARLGRDLRPVFHQYLYYPTLPVLELRPEADRMTFRWRADVEDFDMPVKVRVEGEIRTLFPTTGWSGTPLEATRPEDWEPATDLFYIDVERR